MVLSEYYPLLTPSLHIAKDLASSPLPIPVRYLSISSPFRFWNRKFSILSVSFWYWYWNEHLWGIDIGIGFETASAGFWYWYWFWNSFCWVLVLVLVLKLASAGFWYWYWFWIWFYVSVLISKNDSWSLVWYWIYVALKRHCRTHKMQRPFSCTTCDYSFHVRNIWLARFKTWILFRNSFLHCSLEETLQNTQDAKAF